MRWYFHRRGWHERWFEKPIDGGPDGEIIERTAEEIFGPMPDVEPDVPDPSDSAESQVENPR
jgi:hypothetical protein